MYTTTERFSKGKVVKGNEIDAKKNQKTVIKLTMKNYLLAFALFFCFDILADTGWSPPLNLFPTSSTTPYIATDLQGNAVAVWYESSNNGTLQAATLVSGQLNWVTTSPVASTVLFPNSQLSTGSPLAIDPSGTAYVTWTDGENIWISNLPFGESVWSAPTPLNIPLPSETVGNPTLAISPNGAHILVIWVSQNNLYSNSYNGFLQAWQGQSVGIALQETSPINQVVIDNMGDGVTILSQTATQILAFRFNFNTNAWTAVSPLASSENPSSSLAIDFSGNCTLLSMARDGSVLTAYLPKASPTFINPQVLSTSGQNLYSFPALQPDLQGDILAVWPETTGNIASARFTAVSGNWTLLSPIVLELNPANLNLISDANGNSLLSWTLLLNSSTGVIETAALATNHINWQMVSLISMNFNNERNPQSVLTTNGDAIVIWEDDAANSTEGAILSSVFTGLFASPTDLIPLNFSGQVLQNRSLNKNDTIHRLTWNNNPNPVIISYILLRNGALVSTFDPNFSLYIFDDNGRGPTTDNYTLFSMTATNVTSVPLTILLP